MKILFEDKDIIVGFQPDYLYVYVVGTNPGIACMYYYQDSETEYKYYLSFLALASILLTANLYSNNYII